MKLFAKLILLDIMMFVSFNCHGPIGIMKIEKYYYVDPVDYMKIIWQQKDRKFISKKIKEYKKLRVHGIQ